MRGRDAGEAVVDVGVEEQQDERRSDPAESERGDGGTGGVRHPFDDAGLCESRGERHQGAHPEHGIPGALLTQDIFPVDDVDDDHDADGCHGDWRRADVREAGCCPEEERAEKDDRQVFLTARHRSHGVELFLCEVLGIRDADELRFRQFEHDERHEQ